MARRVDETQERLDVIVLGGGPAGATAAMVLAGEGLRVRVLEKARFPRFHVGESLLPYNVGLFEELGIAEMVAGCGYPVKRAAQFWSGAGRPGARLEFAKGTFTEFKHAYQVERSVFDEQLLREAERRGAEVWEGCGYVSHAMTAEAVRVTCRDEAGETRELQSRFIIDATGMQALTARKSGLRRDREGHRKVAMFGHFEGVEMPKGEQSGDIVLLVRDRAWVWMIPLDERRTSVGLVMGRREYDAGRVDHEALWERIVRETPELKRRMQVASRLGALHVEADYSFSVDRLVEPRLVRAGDAAGFLDPVFSSGVMLAMESGRDAARVVAEAVARGRTMTRAMKAYEKAVHDHLALFWRFVEVFYTRPFIELFLQPSPVLNLMSAINAVLAGRARLPWAARWRLEVFFWLVRLQKHVPLARRLKWRDGSSPEMIRRAGEAALPGELETVPR